MINLSYAALVHDRGNFTAMAASGNKLTFADRRFPAVIREAIPDVAGHGPTAAEWCPGQAAAR